MASGVLSRSSKPWDHETPKDHKTQKYKGTFYSSLKEAPCARPYRLRLSRVCAARFGKTEFTGLRLKLAGLRVENSSLEGFGGLGWRVCFKRLDSSFKA